MAVLISGILRDGAGKPIQNCTIHLHAKRNSMTVIMGTTSSTITGSDGKYSIQAEPGYYSVSLAGDGFRPIDAGDIHVAQTDAPDTLNAFLTAPNAADITPDILKRFSDMVNRAVVLFNDTKKSRDDAVKADEDAKKSRDDATKAAEDAKKSRDEAVNAAGLAAEKSAADTADKISSIVAEDVKKSAAAVKTAGEHADSAATSATAASTSAATSTDSAKKSDSSAAAAALSEKNAALSAAEALTSATSAEKSAADALDKISTLAEAAAINAANDAVLKLTAEIKSELSKKLTADGKYSVNSIVFAVVFSSLPSYGDIVSGDVLKPGSIEATYGVSTGYAKLASDNVNIRLPGSWKCLGGVRFNQSDTSFTEGKDHPATLFVRVA